MGFLPYAMHQNGARRGGGGWAEMKKLQKKSTKELHGVWGHVRSQSRSEKRGLRKKG